MTGGFQQKTPTLHPNPYEFSGTVWSLWVPEAFDDDWLGHQIILGDITKQHTCNPSRQKTYRWSHGAGGERNRKPLMEAEGDEAEWWKGLGTRWGRSLHHTMNVPMLCLLSSGKFHVTWMSPSKNKYIPLKQFKCSQLSSTRMDHTLVFPLFQTMWAEGTDSSWEKFTRVGESQYLAVFVWGTSPQPRGHCGRITFR